MNGGRGAVPASAPGARAAGRTEAGAPLDAWRRLDWRFLLPSPDLGPTAFLGPPGDELLVALTLTGLDVTAVDDPARPPAPGRFQTVVLADPAPAALAPAAELVRPSGWLYAELRGTGRPRVPPRTLSTYRARLRRLGLVDVETHWPASSLATCAFVAPLADRGAVRNMLGRHQGVPGGRVKSLIARGLLATGAIGLAVRDAMLLARRPEEGAA